MEPKFEEIIRLCPEISGLTKNPKFKHIKDKLSKIKVTLESFPFFNPELNRNKDGNIPEDENLGIYEKNIYKGQKIYLRYSFQMI